jgi:hypothetical protein
MRSTESLGVPPLLCGQHHAKMGDEQALQTAEDDLVEC